MIPEFSFVIRLPAKVGAAERTVKRVIEAAPAFSFRLEQTAFPEG